MDFLEEDIVYEETYEVADDFSLLRVPNPSGNNKIPSINQRSTHNSENVCNNVNKPDRFHTILANITTDDDVHLIPHFFNLVEQKENNDIIAKCLGCDKLYKAKSNIHSNLFKHLKVSFQFYIFFSSIFDWIPLFF